MGFESNFERISGRKRKKLIDYNGYERKSTNWKRMARASTTLSGRATASAGLDSDSLTTMNLAKTS